jgi:hypothetical protein
MSICCIEGCNTKVLARNLCSKHYAKFRKYNDPLVVKLSQLHGLSTKDRFYARIQSRGECLEWTGYKDPNGYGRMNMNNVPVPVHRIAWEIYNDSPIPQGLHVLHTCDNPACVRQDHLFLGDQNDNNQDCIRKGRARHAGAKGEDHRCAKLTENQVLEIRLSSDKGVVLANLYGVSTSTISDIRNKKIWTHL